MHRNILILADGYPDLKAVKTAISLLQYRTGDILAVIDADQAGQTTDKVFGQGGETPIIASLSETDALPHSPDSLYIGLAPPGGRLPGHWRTLITTALSAGLDIVSGLHTSIGDDPEWARLAAETGARIQDLRKNTFREVATRKDLRPECLRIHTVGTDCNIGKMVTTLELTKALQASGHDARFVATGQTGMMIAGNGLPIDAIVSDFVSGAAEHLVRQHQHHDILCIEGQGSLTSPMYSAVTVGLLHGCLPDGLILCHEATRTHYRHTDIPLPPIEELLPLYESMSNIQHPCRVIGISLNSKALSDTAYNETKHQLASRFQLPVVDPIRERTAAPLARAALSRVREIRQLP